MGITIERVLQIIRKTINGDAKKETEEYNCTDTYAFFVFHFIYETIRFNRNTQQ